jgi:hypothetical protein
MMQPAAAGPARNGGAPADEPASRARAANGGGGPAEISLDGVSPAAPVKGDTVKLSGIIHNTAKRAFRSPTAGIRMTGGALSSRSEISAVLERTRVTPADGTAVPGTAKELPSIAAGKSSSFELSVPVKKLRLSGNGVYQLSVEVRGANGTSLGIVRTFLPWYPTPGSVKPTRMATLWPVIDQPRLSARTLADYQQTPVFLNDGLTGEMEQGGRLDKLVKLGGNLPVTWVLDPDLVLTADAMTGKTGYRVADPGHKPLTGRGGSTAQEWLDQLKWAMVNSKDAAPALKQLQERSEKQPDENKDGAGQDTDNDTDTGKEGTTEPSKSPTGSSAPPQDEQDEQDDPLPNPRNFPHDEMLALPTGDPDLASIAHNGSGVRELPKLLREAQELSAAATSGVIGGDPRTDVAWPVAGALDPSVVKAGRQSRASVFIAGSRSIRQTSLAYTPSSQRPIGGGNKALVADSRVSEIFSRDLSSKAERTLAVQEFLAQTLLITMEAPSKARTLLVTPPRRMSKAAAGTLATALKAVGHGQSWVDPVSLSTVEKAPADPAATRTVPPVSAYPAELSKQQLSAEALGQVGHVHDQLAELVPILTQQQRVTAPFGKAMMRAVATAWREDRPGEQRYQQATNEYLKSLMGAVRIADKSTEITLSGQSGRVPLTVINNLEQKVRVKLVLVTEQRNRITIGEGKFLTIPGRENRQVQFPVTARTNGRVTVEAQLLDDKGHRYGEPESFTLNVTSVGTTVLLVVGAGMLLVIVAVIRMYRKRARRNGIQDDPNAPLPLPDDPEPASDPDATSAQGTTADDTSAPEGHATGTEHSDTADGSAEHPGPDEKVDR